MRGQLTGLHPAIDRPSRVLDVGWWWWQYSLHAVDPVAAGLQDFGSHPDQFLEKQIRIWSRQYMASRTPHDTESSTKAFSHLMAWLPTRIPHREGHPPPVALVHGDYRLDNTVCHPTRPEVVAVLDWELATLGHPMADVRHSVELAH